VSATAMPASDVPNSDSKKSSVDVSALSSGSSITNNENKIATKVLQSINNYRKYYIAVNPDSSMIASKDYLFDSFADLIYFLPKSLSMVILEPNPFRIISANSGHTQGILRLLFLPWAFFVSFSVLIVLYKINKSFSFDKILLQIYTLATLMPYAYFIPNYGNVARYSSFAVTLMLMILIFSKSNTKLKKLI